MGEETIDAGGGDEMKTELFGPLFGEFQPKNVYAIYGVPNVGKTVLAMTEVAALESQGVRTLWLDTEGGLNFDSPSGIWGAWKPKLEKRFGLKDMNELVDYRRFVDYDDLMKWLGYQVDVEYGEGKMNVQFRGKVRGSEPTVYDAGGFGRKRDNCLIVIDSMSSLFRLQFGSTLQNFPGRGDATAYLVFALSKLMERVNAPLITTNHASLNPTNPWQMAGMRGGSTVSYYSKNVAYLEKPKKKVLDTYRKCWAVRSPGAKEWGNSCWMHIDTDKAFVSSTEADITAILEAAKKGKEDEE
jgi:hypothetical protein